MICGVEEPLLPNECIYALNEETDALKLSHLSLPSLNRYSFLWLGNFQERQAKTEELLQAILRHTLQINERSAYWISAWGVPSHGTARQKQTMMNYDLYSSKLRTAEHWEISREEGADDTCLNVAIKPVDVAWLNGFSPSDYEGANRSRLLLLIGTVPASSEIMKGPARPVLQHMATYGSVAPSEPFLFWLADRELTLIYRSDQDHHGPGLIYVGAERLPIELFLENGILQRVTTGEKALQGRF